MIWNMRWKMTMVKKEEIMRKKYKEPTMAEMGEMMAEMQIQLGKQQREIYKLRQMEREHGVGRLARRPAETYTEEEFDAYNKIHQRVMDRYGYTEDEAGEYMEEY